MNRKKLFLFGGISIVVVAATLLSVQMFSKAAVNCQDAEFSKYISAYSGGYLSKTASFKVRMLSDFAQKIQNRDEIVKKLFDITPNIKGSAYWVDNTTVEFKPEEPLKPNTEYRIAFNLGKLGEIDSKHKNFVFECKTIAQNLEVEVLGQQTTSKTSLDYQQILGVIRTADTESPKNIQKVLKASLEGKILNVKWKENSNGNEHFFVIDSISRKATSQNVSLEWNGNSIETEKKGSQKVEIPSLTDFKCLGIRVLQQPEQFVEIQFSDPLKETQDIQGLITISNNSSLRYLIDGNILKIYLPQRITGTKKIAILQGIQNIQGTKLSQKSDFTINFEDIKPAVRWTNNGVILPTSAKGLIYPFEAVNLKAVNVKIVKIFENNILQFLQYNDLGGSGELVRVGKVILKKTIPLNKMGITDFSKWNRFYLDLNQLISTEPGAIYRVVLSFKKDFSTYPCSDSDNSQENLEKIEVQEEIPQQSEPTYWDSYDSEPYNYDEYNWNERENPCHSTYFREKIISQNIIASDLGIIAKLGTDNSLKIFVTDLKTTKPQKGIMVEVFDYQQQKIIEKETDSDGAVDFPEIKNAYFVVAKQNSQRGYLKVNDGSALQMSMFNIAGASVKKGLKGFIYGERGVWRPGDSIFLAFILKEDAHLEKLPLGHPIILEFRNPQNQLVKRVIENKNNSNFYVFPLKTAENAPTGNWEVKISVGGATFYKNLKIETVKPNRLKINFNFAEKFLRKDKNISATMNVKWLHGAIAKGLQTDIDVVLTPSKTEFENFSEYNFDDPAKHYYSEPRNIFSGKTNDDGNLDMSFEIPVKDEAPGKMNASFITKVFEKGGDFSIDQLTIPYYPYSSFTGIKVPKGDFRGMLTTDTNQTVQLVVLDAEGKIVNENDEIEMTFYKLDWRWWWDRNGDDLSYIAHSYIQPLKKEKISTQNGKANWNIRVNYPDWGRYLVRAKNLATGHSTAKVIYIDWPGWAGRQEKDHSQGATMLTFSTDKEKYAVDDKVKITFPSSKDGRALINIENGTKTLKSFWVETKNGQTEFEFKATADMSPNVYATITLLQPHSQTANDLPIRLYGTLPIFVEDAKSHLEPIIEMPSELESEQNYSVKVSEKNNAEMYYTIAVVDEGLLDLTRFKTPQPWNEFFAKEGLGVKSFDLFDMVIGAFGGELERLLNIGGDEGLGSKAAKKATRFKPVVKFLGPFYLKGGSAKHELKMDKYIGSVKVMLVAQNPKGAYGCAEKAVPVRKPLMLLATLPRVLGNLETLKLPVSVFAMDKNISSATVEVKTNEFLQITGEKQKTIAIKDEGEHYLEFDIQANLYTGIGKVSVFATAGSQKASYDIEIDVRNPNPAVTKVLSKTLSANETWEENVKPFGILSSNSCVLEVSSIPPLNLEKRLNDLIMYPHGCIEQTTSAAFAQLFLENVIELNSDQKSRISDNIKIAISKISTFQLANGGLSYWPGMADVCEWGTTYAGHFVIEAEKKGFAIPNNFLKRWKNYQIRKANNWTDDGPISQYEQSYRLYTLALMGEAEISAMNRLKENPKLRLEAKWRLAAAYFLAGKEEVARNLTKNLSKNVAPYNELSYTFGSDTRDLAMILETLSLLGNQKECFDIISQISERLGSEDWLSTQTTAYSLIAICQFIGKNKPNNSLKYTYQIDNGASQNYVSQISISQIPLKYKDLSNISISVKNTSGGMLFARVLNRGIPEVGEGVDAENKLKMSIAYKTTDGKALDIEKIEQGTDFLAEVTVTNIGTRHYQELALTQIFPSGWEIINTRLIEQGNFAQVSIPKYQDFRDDRVYSYFDLLQNQSQTYRIILNAAYVGKFFLPVTSVEAMYDGGINASKKGRWVEVVKNSDL